MGVKVGLPRTATNWQGTASESSSFKFKFKFNYLLSSKFTGQFIGTWPPGTNYSQQNTAMHSDIIIHTDHLCDSETLTRRPLNFPQRRHLSDVWHLPDCFIQHSEGISGRNSWPFGLPDDGRTSQSEYTLT